MFHRDALCGNEICAMPVGNLGQDFGIFTVINANEFDSVHGCRYSLNVGAYAFSAFVVMSLVFVCSLRIDAVWACMKNFQTVAIERRFGVDWQVSPCVLVMASNESYVSWSQ